MGDPLYIKITDPELCGQIRKNAVNEVRSNTNMVVKILKEHFEAVKWLQDNAESINP